MDNDNKNNPVEEPEAHDALGASVVVSPIKDDKQPESEKVEKTADVLQTETQQTDALQADDSRTDAPNADDIQDEAESDRHLKEAIAEQAREDERPHSSNFTLGKILGGDILTAQTLRNNIWLIVLVVGFVVLYITNRYKVQKDLLEIDKLNTELEDAKYRALSSSSNLTEKTRESHVLESLQNGPDSTLKQSDRPPYIIEVPDK